jgi:dTDP-4-amino-4,6-dideoxygalactose transaminase
MSDLAILGGRPVRSRPFPSWPRHTKSDAERLLRVLESGNWGGYPFPNTLAREFAGSFAFYHNAQYGCCVANGTVAITIALRAAGVRFGDEVIVPAYTWDGTATAVLDAGAVPVFADVRRDTYCLDLEAARRAITPRTRATVPVHLAMRFAEMDGIRRLAAEHGLIIVEDCAHAHGGQYNGRGAGSMGDLGTFSFQSSKIMTSGEGGAVISSRLDYFEAVQSIVNCGRASETDQYKQRIAGGNYRITEFQAALLIGQLEQLPELAARRSRNAALLTRELERLDSVAPLPPQPEITREAIYNYVFRYLPGNSGVSRDVFVAALDAEGIPCDGRFYEPVYRSDLFKVNARDYPQLAIGREYTVDYSTVHCPVAERAAYEESVWLPQFLLLGDEEDVDDTVTAIGKVIQNRRELREAGGDLAGAKAMSRAERPKIEMARNY